MRVYPTHSAPEAADDPDQSPVYQRKTKQLTWEEVAMIYNVEKKLPGERPINRDDAKSAVRNACMKLRKKGIAAMILGSIMGCRDVTVRVFPNQINTDTVYSPPRLFDQPVIVLNPPAIPETRQDDQVQQWTAFWELHGYSESEAKQKALSVMRMK